MTPADADRILSETSIYWRVMDGGARMLIGGECTAEELDALACLLRSRQEAEATIRGKASS